MNTSIPSASSANSRPFSKEEQVTPLRNIWGQMFWDPRLSLSINELGQSQSQQSSKLGQELDAMMDKFFAIDIANGELDTHQLTTVFVEESDDGDDDIGSMAPVFLNGHDDDDDDDDDFYYDDDNKDDEISHNQLVIEPLNQSTPLIVDQDTLRSNSSACTNNILVTVVDDKNTSMTCTDESVPPFHAEKGDSTHTTDILLTPQASKSSRPINSMCEDPTLVRPTGLHLPRYGWFRRFLFGKTTRGVVS